MTDGTLLRALRHNTWANLKLIEHCAGLTAEQLALTVPGTFGTIHATLGHIVGAEHGYLLRLTGEAPKQGPLQRGQIVPLDELRERARDNGERIEEVFAGSFDPTKRVELTNGSVTAGVIAAQYIHHGNDHRAHIGTILGANHLDPPDTQVWAWADETAEFIKKD